MSRRGDPPAPDLTPKQKELLTLLQGGWRLSRPARWEEYYRVPKDDPDGPRTPVNVKTARALLEHGVLIVEERVEGHIFYKVKEQPQ